MKGDILDFILRYGDRLVVEELQFKLGEKSYRVVRRRDGEGYYYTLLLKNNTAEDLEVHSADNIIDLIRALVVKAETPTGTRFFGHKVVQSPATERWVYADDRTLIGRHRRCPKCNDYPTSEGHDPCLGDLQGVAYACCGHGDIEYAYVTFEDGRGTLRGEEALRYFCKHSCRVWKKD